VTKKFFQRVQFVRVLIEDIVIAGDDVHVYLILSQLLKKNLSIVFERLEVNKLAIVIVVTKM